MLQYLLAHSTRRHRAWASRNVDIMDAHLFFVFVTVENERELILAPQCATRVGERTRGRE